MFDEIDPGDFAPGWDDIPEQTDFQTFQNNAEKRKPWVVLLRFSKDGKRSFGTGFFVNLPGTQDDVILTAGHNLLGSTGMRVFVNELGSTSNGINTSEENTGIEVNEQDFRICPEYVHDQDDKFHDYGIILLKPKLERPGFGFNIRFASQGLGEKGHAWDPLLDKIIRVDNSCLQVYITGYQDDSPGETFEGQGQLITKVNDRVRQDQLEYKIETKEGVSGSPVWRVDRGGESVIGIHNNGPSGRGRGSRATRLNEKVLRRIFKWVGVGYESRALKAWSPKADPRGGLYLQFRPGDDEAWLGRGPDSPPTRFDVLPAYTRPGKLEPEQALYAFYYKDAVNLDKGKWVAWRWEQEKAELKDIVTNHSLVSLREMPKKEGFKIVLERETTVDEREAMKVPQSTILVELAVDDSMITDYDIERAKSKGEPAQVQDFLSFTRFKRPMKIEYNVFCLEQSGSE
ncbi:hypothetical protein F5884DRAFT_900848 [Xylogone sp. PMI_703]|nr:hypothetical protein F5884DRAFT_900848 [Xylogone sp. PMI_703]